MANLNYYEILGVSVFSSARILREAYKKRSQKMHPDKGGTEEAFKELKKAYEVLSNPLRRAVYDAGLKGKYNPEELEKTIKAQSRMIVNEALNKMEMTQDDFLIIIERIIGHNIDETEENIELVSEKVEKIASILERVTRGEETFIIKGLESKLTEGKVLLENEKINLAALFFLRANFKQIDLTETIDIKKLANPWSVMHEEV